MSFFSSLVRPAEKSVRERQYQHRVFLSQPSTVPMYLRRGGSDKLWLGVTLAAFGGSMIIALFNAQANIKSSKHVASKTKDEKTKHSAKPSPSAPPKSAAKPKHEVQSKASHSPQPTVEPESEPQPIVSLSLKPTANADTEPQPKVSHSLKAAVKHDAYDDDFEAYEEDFEDFDDSPKAGAKKPFQPSPSAPATAIALEMQKAMEEENQGRRAVPNQPAGKASASVPVQEVVLPDRQAASKVKPVISKESRVKQVKNNVARYSDLSKVVEFSLSVMIDLFDLAPVTEYEMYIRSFGAASSVQVYTQTSDEVINVEIQCEDWRVLDKDTQAPEFVTSSTPDDDSVTAQKDSKLLEHFLETYKQLIEIIMLDVDESQGDLIPADKPTSLSSSKSSSRNFEIPVSDVSLSKVTPSAFEPNVVMAIYSSKDNTDRYQIKNGVVIIETSGRSSFPVSILKSPYVTLTCCCFGPRTLIFAGTSTGGIVAWSGHSDDTDEDRGYPIFTTDGAYVENRAHEFPIRALHLLGDFSEDKGNQLLSMDESGLCIIWTIRILSLQDGDEWFLVGSSSSIGVQLLKSLSFYPWDDSNRSPFIMQELGVIMDCILFPTTNSTKSADLENVLIATESGTVLQRSRYQKPCYPRNFIGQISEVDSAMCMSSRHSADDPCVSSNFLVGYLSGRVAIFSSLDKAPIRLINVSEKPIKELHWAAETFEFFALDEDGYLTAWNARFHPARQLIRLGGAEGVGLDEPQCAIMSFGLPDPQLKVTGSLTNLTNRKSRQKPAGSTSDKGTSTIIRSTLLIGLANGAIREIQVSWAATIEV